MSGPIVMKFGGTSVADAGRLRQVSGIARAMQDRGVLVVLSAFAGATNALLESAAAAAAGDAARAVASIEGMLERHRDEARNLLGDGGTRDYEELLARARDGIEPLLRGAALLRAMPERNLDAIAGWGEILSSRLLAAHMGVPWIDARTALVTDSCHGRARPRLRETSERAAAVIAPHVAPGGIAVTQGYIGADGDGVPTTLGRGGSDYSASVFGAALGAEEIQIWTDVEGVFTCDPRLVPEALHIGRLGYDEASELAAFGAKVLHPLTILPAIERGIPVTVRDSSKPRGRMTTIARDSGSGRPVVAIAARAPVVVVTASTPRMLGGSGFLARIFDSFGRRGASADLVATSEVSVSATLDPGQEPDGIVADLSEFATVKVERDKAVVAVVGERMHSTPGVAGRAFSALGGINVDMISMGSGQINLSFVVDAKDAPEAQRRLHRAFFGAYGENES